MNDIFRFLIHHLTILIQNSDSCSQLAILQFTFDKEYRPETSFIFLLLGTGNVLVFFYIYPIVLHAPAFLNSFQFPVTVVTGIELKRHSYFYSVLESFLCYSISIRYYFTQHYFSHSSLYLGTNVK